MIVLRGGVTIVTIKNWLDTKQTSWILAYILTLTLPWALIFNRGLADASCVVIGLLFLCHSYSHKNFEWLGEPFIKLALSAWLWIAIVVTMFALSPVSSLMSAVPWVRYIILYAALKYWVLTDRKSIELLGVILAGMFCFVIIDTVWQYVYGTSITGNARGLGGRLTGPLSNVKVGIFMAKMLLPMVGICLFVAVTKKNYKYILAILLIFFAAIATIMISGERTAFASIIIAVFFIAFLLAVAEKKLRKWVVLSAAVMILASAILFETQIWVQKRADDFYSVISNYQETEYGQLQKAGLIIGQEHWFTGAGLKSFRELCAKLFASGVVTTENLHPHNLYVEWFAEAGIIGFLLFSAMVFCLFHDVVKVFIARKDNDRILSGFILACLIVNFFPFMPTQSIFSNWPAILLWYSVSVAISSINMLKEKAD